jgi:hypothetical protein
LVEYQDKFVELVGYTKELEEGTKQVLGELQTLAVILSHPSETGKYLQYQEFLMNELPQVKQFRGQYPAATFDQYYAALEQSVQPQQQQSQPQQPQNIYQNVDPRYGQTFESMPMGVNPQPANNQNVELSNAWRYIDQQHFGQMLGQL